MDNAPITFKTYNWIAKAEIYNKNFKIVPSEWILENADIIALLFTTRGVDKGGIIRKFYNIYESVKSLNVPLEVIHIPLDETEKDFKASFKEQANWFTLLFSDPLVLELKYMYDITCVPHLYIIKSDCTTVSSHGVMDLEEYDKNAVITWLSSSASSKNDKRNSQVYGNEWRYIAEQQNQKGFYRMKFSIEDVPKAAVAAAEKINKNSDNDHKEL